jgi:hypothetical protein
MKRWLSLAFLLALPISAAYALTQASIPAKFPIPWGNSAGGAYVRSIPQNSQIGVQNCAASLTDGFPPLTFVPAGAGGCPPFGQDFNGILKQISQWQQWNQAGGPVFYDSSFAASVGGYPNGAILSSAVTPGTRWLSTVDSNTTSPDASVANQVVGGTGWVQDPGQVPIGTPLQSMTTTIPAGYVSANGQTIGNGSSNATDRANADTQFLFAFVWNNCANAICQIFTSGGVGTSRGATAAADFAANKQLAVWNMNGAGLIGADSQHTTSSANLAGVPVTNGSATAPGSLLGENLHSLTANENGTHTHGVTGGTLGGNANVAGQTGGGFTGVQCPPSNCSVTISNSGLGTPHNTVERSTVVYWVLKL